MSYQPRHLRNPGTPRKPRKPTRVQLGLASLALVLALLPTASTFSAFSATTGNTGNTSSAGTVALTDNDAGVAALTMSNAKPGDTDTACITVTSTGTLPSLVKLYGTTTGSGLDAYLNLTVTRGSGGDADCVGFTPDATDYSGLGAGLLYSDTLTAFPDSYAAGISDPRTASIPEAWTTGEAHAYRFTLTVADDNNAQGKDVTQTFTWEARNTTLYSQVVLSDLPGSYWKLDETNGTTATDARGVANGTYTGGPTLGSVSGLKDANTSITFADVHADRIIVGDYYDFAGTSSFSVELWIKPTAAIGYWRRIVSKEGAGGWNLMLGAQGTGVSNYVMLGRDGGGTDYVDTGTSLVAGTWYHVVATYDGTNMRMYLNGSLRNTVASSRSLPNHAFNLTIGEVTNGSGEGYGGGMDELALYSSALSAQQITEHYNAGRR